VNDGIGWVYLPFTIYYLLAMPTSFPEWIQPMAATLTQERFNGPEWVFERKFDGIRLLAYKKGSRVELFSRNRLPQNVPALSGAIAKLPHQELILDGEIDWHGPTAYHVFDILWLDGRDLTNLTFEERRSILRQLPLARPLLRVSELHDEAPWERAQKQGWEGVIAKRRDSVYEQRRSPNWLKMKCELAQELVVGGFTEPRGKRAGLGALLVGYYEGNDFVFAGKIGTGFNTQLLLELRAKLDRLEIDQPPFTKAVGLPRGSSPTVREGERGISPTVREGERGSSPTVREGSDARNSLRTHWVRPEIVVQVGFIQWTKHNKLRHPRLLGIRNDKHPREVVRE
jgi:bifunctional non-homologous end joining protein LigD